MLTVLVSGPECCSCPCFRLRLGASGCSSGLAYCSCALGYLLGCGARSSPTTGAKTGRTAHVFTAQGGTCRLIEFSGMKPYSPKPYSARFRCQQDLSRQVCPPMHVSAWPCLQILIVAKKLEIVLAIEGAELRKVPVNNFWSLNRAYNFLGTFLGVFELYVSLFIWISRLLGRFRSAEVCPRMHVGRCAGHDWHTCVLTFDERIDAYVCELWRSCHLCTYSSLAHLHTQ